MGSIGHHLHRSETFLHRARCADTSAADVAIDLRRSVSHAATALAVHVGMSHSSTRRLELALHAAISSGQLSRSHVKTLRQVYDLPAFLASTASGDAEHIGGPGCPLRRLRRRAAALLKDVRAITAGQPRPVRYHKRWLRGLPSRLHPRGSEPIASVRDILDLPNYRQIVADWDLEDVPIMRRPDPHGWYELGRQPLPCSCHPETTRMPSDAAGRFPLSPIWRRVLERELGTPVPEVLRA